MTYLNLWATHINRFKGADATMMDSHRTQKNGYDGEGSFKTDDGHPCFTDATIVSRVKG